MPTKDQIINEIFLSLLKRRYEPVVNDIVVDNVVRVGLNKKHQYHLATEDFNVIGDELVNRGLFRWNDDGRLALTETGLKYLERFK